MMRCVHINYGWNVSANWKWTAINTIIERAKCCCHRTQISLSRMTKSCKYFCITNQEKRGNKLWLMDLVLYLAVGITFLTMSLQDINKLFGSIYKKMFKTDKNCCCKLLQLNVAGIKWQSKRYHFTNYHTQVTSLDKRQIISNLFSSFSR